MIRYNAKEVTIAWFRLGVPDIDLGATIDAIRAALKANKPEPQSKGRAA